ncbi:hypothetical protein SPB21_33715 [Leptothoe sp. ISB3NOV94-8A]
MSFRTDLSNGYNLDIAASTSNVQKPVRLNGMRVIFDKVVPVLPIQLTVNGKQDRYPLHQPTPIASFDEKLSDDILRSPHPYPAIPSNQSHRLSQSNLWKIQRQFFEQQGVKAWNKGTVPHYITSNPFIANAYGKVVYGFLQDWYGSNLSNNKTPGIPAQPACIIELGAGSGRFAYHFLKKFFDFFRRSPLKTIPIKYVLTDFSDRNLNF